MTLPLPLDPSLPAVPDDRGLGGLLALVAGVERPLPLEEVRVRATLAGTIARTVVEQTFRNPHATPIEAVHLFPLPEDGVVVEAELHAGDLSVRAECRERGAAEAEFRAARAAGHRAMLLTQERPDIHTLRVTQLPPGETIRVRLVVLERLVVEDGCARWRFPTTIAPRYLPGSATGHEGPGVLPDTDHAPDASRLSPPLRLTGGTRLDLEVFVSGHPTTISSSQHAVQLGFAEGIRVAPAGTATLNKDFVLAVQWANEGETEARAWTDGAYTLVHVVPPISTTRVLPRDAVFVVDISGSMGGGKMEAAKRALRSALHGLVPGDRFRLIAFDDRVEHFAAGFTPYDERSLGKADRWIAGLAPRGGTEMLAPLVAALEGERTEGRVHTVLFVTDGQAHNDQELMAAVAGRRRGALVFTLGIDTAVNGALLKGLARLGGGACTLCTPTDDIDAVVARIEARFGSPVLTDVRVAGEEARPEPAVLFTGIPGRFLLRGAPAEVQLSGRTSGGPWTARATPEALSTPIGALWARERVAWLEDRLVLRPFEEEAIRPEILRIAEAAGITSRYTAFVAVERTRVVGGGEPTVVVQPAEAPEGWSLLREEAAGGAAAPMPARASGGAPGLGRARGAPPPPPAAAPAPSPKSAYRLGDVAEDLDLAAPPAVASGGVFREMAKRVMTTLDARRVPVSTPTGTPDAVLAATQGADGSFGGDVARTAAALVVLVLLGHTRRSGLRKRTVTKAAAWLGAHAGAPEVDRALRLLADAEAGRPLDRGWSGLHGAGPEGALLAGLG